MCTIYAVHICIHSHACTWQYGITVFAHHWRLATASVMRKHSAYDVAPKCSIS